MIASSPAFCSIQLDVAMSYKKIEVFIYYFHTFKSKASFRFLFFIPYPLLPSPPARGELSLSGSHLQPGNKGDLPPRHCSCPWGSPRAALGSAGWDGAFTHLWNIASLCGWLVGWFFLSLVFTVFFYGSLKQLPQSGQLC